MVDTFYNFDRIKTDKAETDKADNFLPFNVYDNKELLIKIK